LSHSKFTPSEALNRIRSRGLEISIDGDSIKVAGLLSKEQVAFLTEHKARLVAELRRETQIPVECWTPSGLNVEVLADSEEEAKQLRKWNPFNKTVDNS
jgi:hypothetical protein